MGTLHEQVIAQLPLLKSALEGMYIDVADDVVATIRRVACTEGEDALEVEPPTAKLIWSSLQAWPEIKMALLNVVSTVTSHIQTRGRAVLLSSAEALHRTYRTDWRTFALPGSDDRYQMCLNYIGRSSEHINIQSCVDAMYETAKKVEKALGAGIELHAEVAQGFTNVDEGNLYLLAASAIGNTVLKPANPKYIQTKIAADASHCIAALKCYNMWTPANKPCLPRLLRVELLRVVGQSKEQAEINADQ